MRIHTRDYTPAFDEVNFNYLPDLGRTIFIFHVVDGDNLFPNNAWISEDDLSDDNLIELLNCISWDIW